MADFIENIEIVPSYLGVPINEEGLENAPVEALDYMLNFINNAPTSERHRYSYRYLSEYLDCNDGKYFKMVHRIQKRKHIEKLMEITCFIF